jgi:hypothetical protein
MDVVALPVLSVRQCADRPNRGRCSSATSLLVLAMLAVMVGTGPLHAVGDRPLQSRGEPLAAPSAAFDPAVWTPPLSNVSFLRLSDGRQRLGQLLGLTQPRLGDVRADVPGDATGVAAVILLRLVADRDHGVRAPPWFGRANGTPLLGT